MAKFVDKQNLIQYKYFNNLVSREKEVGEVTSNYLAGLMQLTNRQMQAIPREYMEATLLFNRGRKKLPALLYASEEERQKCQKAINSGNARQTKAAAEKYLDILTAVPYFQGRQIGHKVGVKPELLDGLSEKEKNKRFKFDRKDGRYYSSFFSVPKLVLVRGEMFEHYLMQEPSLEDMEKLDSLFRKDVHYIINVQSEEQNEYAYLIEKEEGISVQRLEKSDIIRKKSVSWVLENHPEMAAVLCCLLDYLIELEKIEKLQKKQKKEKGQNDSYDADRSRCSRYVDQNSIKIFDMKSDGGQDGYELEVNYFKKRNGRMGARRTGYEMAPHTRRGHYRTYQNGKTVYVRSSVIHKEKYGGIQSAHRINDAQNAAEVEPEEGRQGFGMGMQM